MNTFPDRCFAFDEFGPLNIRPIGGNCWAQQSEPQRQPANYHKLHGVRQFHGCYSIGDDTMWVSCAAASPLPMRSLHCVRSELRDLTAS